MEKRAAFIFLFCAVALWFWAGASLGLANDNRTDIDPDAVKIIKALGEQSRQTKYAKIKVFDTMEEIQESGRMIQYSHVRNAVISKPDKLWLQSAGDRSNTTMWKDKTLFTLLDGNDNIYVQLDAPGTIEQTVDMIYEKYGISTPLADMLSSDIYEVLMGRVKTCSYLGLHHAGEAVCHHIAATQDDIDWQIWIDQGAEPIIHKIVIVYKQLPGSPRYSAVLAEHTKLDTVPDATFTFQPPPGVEKIQPIPREKEMKPRLKKAGKGGQ